jgi:SOS-response transcriptional repressor LexA
MGAISPTARQMDLLRYIAGYAEAHRGVMPSMIEMRDAIGVRSKSTVGRLLGGMEQRGLIRRLRDRARAIELLAAPPVPRGPRGEPLYFIPLDRMVDHDVGNA